MTETKQRKYGSNENVFVQLNQMTLAQTKREIYMLQVYEKTKAQTSIFNLK